MHQRADFGNMHCMNADLSNLSRLMQNLIRLGTIAEVEGAKARVQLGPKLTTEWLNWITQRAGSTCTWSAPTVGEQVMVLSPGGDLARGIILPALFSKAFDVPETSDTIHTTHYPDGNVVQYDHAAHALTATVSDLRRDVGNGELHAWVELDHQWPGCFRAVPLAAVISARAGSMVPA